MYAIEFETDIKDGVLRIPEKYRQLKDGHARVVIMVQEDLKPEIEELSLDLSGCEVQAFSNIDALKIQREMRDEW
ncbi:hypothetical protein [Marinobacter sp. ATCH36]|uniref:hypothetical protein n=1 Tax=Marinobacter sp. ATCH36 TaxID=2945106 RepID=UPI002021C7E3|nr:hypothetical protein [Marinobacter sp. ATCH36]MCL7945165.1 hypothetical protein [Marinobacter sp. ATCH36]